MQNGNENVGVIVYSKNARTYNTNTHTHTHIHKPIQHKNNHKNSLFRYVAGVGSAVGIWVLGVRIADKAAACRCWGVDCPTWAATAAAAADAAENEGMDVATEDDAGATVEEEDDISEDDDGLLGMRLWKAWRVNDAVSAVRFEGTMGV